LEEENKLLEIKYQTRIVELPQEHHLLQTRIYEWLTGLPAELMYITPDGIKGYLAGEPLTDEEMIGLVKNPKSPMWTWECRYCSYSRFCPKSSMPSENE